MYPGLGIAPVIVSYAVGMLVPAIESLFHQDQPAASFPDEKAGLDQWAAIVNLDPTLVTQGAQDAWVSLRCAAGDGSVAADATAAMRRQAGPKPPGWSGAWPPASFTTTCPGCVDSTGQCQAYALAAVRVLTTVQQQAQPQPSNPSGSGLYSGTLPTPLPSLAVASPTSTLGGIPATTLALYAVGAVALMLILQGRR